MIDFKEIITTEVLAEYLTADFGKDLVIWEELVPTKWRIPFAEPFHKLPPQFVK